MPDDKRFYTDFTGTGNSLNMQHPRTIQLIMDSLRYWVTEMHVDGFRFDLAPVLARELYDVDRLSAFFDIMHQDPDAVAREADRRAVGRGAGRLPGGQLPGRAGRSGTASTATACGRSGAAMPGQVLGDGERGSPGSSDIFSWSDRGVYASINFITAHDGYTLRDLVSYEQKHNEANGEGNRDGHNDNLSRNWGVEGETDDAAIVERRHRADAQHARDAGVLAGRADARRTATRWGARRAATTTRTRRTTRSPGSTGSSSRGSGSCSDFTRRVIAHPPGAPGAAAAQLLPRRGRSEAAGQKDVTWIRPDGQEMTDADWRDGATHGRSGMLIDGAATDEVDERGRPCAATRCCCCSTRARRRRLHAAGAGGRGRLGEAHRHGGGRGGTARRGHAAPDGFALALLRHGVERRVGWTGASAENAALVNAASVGGVAGIAAAELSMSGLFASVP